jgi:Caenorhabditis protein of unknown function, DUF268
MGMYGDPLDPDGDLKAMRKMKQRIKLNGLLFLAVPVGRDKILFKNVRNERNIGAQQDLGRLDVFGTNINPTAMMGLYQQCSDATQRFNFRIEEVARTVAVARAIECATYLSSPPKPRAIKTRNHLQQMKKVYFSPCFVLR